MASINLKKVISGNVEDGVKKITEALQAKGFGILTRIDLHSKIKEKTGKDIQPTVILGACNPNLAYEAFSRNTDVASLLPCNAVVRQIAPNQISLEIIKPSAMMEFLKDAELVGMAKSADESLSAALNGC